MKINRLILCMAGIVLLPLLFCVTPENPDNPGNATGILQFTSSDGSTSDSLIVDTAGNVVTIEVSYKLIYFIDSIAIQIVSRDSTTTQQNLDTAINYQLPPNSDEQQQTFTITLKSAGIKTVTLTTYKTNGTISTDYGRIIVYPRTAQKNAPPVFMPGSPALAYLLNKGDLLTIPVAATDLENDSVTYQFFFTEPVLPRYSSATLRSGQFSWQSQPEDTGTYRILFKALDKYGFAISRVTVVVGDTSQHRAPEITSSPVVVVAEGETWHYTPAAVDFKNSALTWRLSGNKSPLMQFNPVDGTISWTPTAGVNSSDQLTLTVTNSSTPPLSDSQTFVVAVVPATDTPFAIGQTLHTDGAEPIALVLSAYHKADSLLTFTITRFSGNGTIDTTGLPIVTYTPAENFSGIDTIEFTATATGTITSTKARIIINVSGGNTPPVAAPLSLGLKEDTSLKITLEGTDSRTSSTSLVYSITKTVTIGTLSTLEGNSISYTPPDDFFGADSFFYRVFDGELYSDTAKVLLIVEAVNDTPKVLNQALATDLNTQLTLTLKGSDTEDDILQFQIIKNPASGSLDTSALPAIKYTPSIDFKGNDTITYRVIDSEGLQSIYGLITIAVAQDNVKPTAAPLSITVPEDNDTSITLSGSDIETPSDQLTYSIYRQPSHGTLGNISGNHVVYSPAANYNGPDTFYYTVNDGTLDSDSGRVVLHITPVNDNPVANEDMYTTNEDQPLTIIAAEGVLSNDSDPENDALTAEIVDSVPASKGSLLFNLNGSFVFTPAPNAFGIATFTYRVNDAQGGVSGTATGTITITAVDDPSVVSGLTAILVNEGDSVTQEIVATDPDVATPALSITSGEKPWITVAQLSSNRIRLVVKPDNSVVLSGTQAVFKLHFRVADGQQYTDDSLSITVVNVNQKPAVSLSLAKVTDTVMTGSSLPLSVTASDNDGTIAKVVLYHNGTPETDITAPYQFSLSSLTYGIHTVRAVAFDNNNDSTGTVTYTIKAAKWKPKTFSTTDRSMFDNNGVPVRSTYNLYSDRLNMEIASYNMISETWASLGALSIDSSTFNRYLGTDRYFSYSLAFTSNNLPVLLMNFTKPSQDPALHTLTFVVYAKSSGGTWNQAGTTVIKPDLNPMRNFNGTMAASANGPLAFYLTETEQRSTVSSTLYVLNGTMWDSIANPSTYTDISYLNSSFYAHCGSYIYENPVKVHVLTGSVWSPVGGDGTVTGTSSQHNILSQNDNGALYISVPDRGVFTYNNSDAWQKLWPLDDADSAARDFSVSILDGTPYFTYTAVPAGQSASSLFVKKIQNGAVTGAFDDSGLVGALPASFYNVSILSKQRILMFTDISSDILSIYRLDIPN